MTSFVMTPQMKQMIWRAKNAGGSTTCDPRAFYPAGHICAGTTFPVKPSTYIKLGPQLIDSGGVPVPPDARITRSVPTEGGGAVTDFETDTDSVTAVTDANGGVKAVEVKNKWLVPAALAAAFFLFGG